jgi:hypothetical protein
MPLRLLAAMNRSPRRAARPHPPAFTQGAKPQQHIDAFRRGFNPCGDVLEAVLAADENLRFDEFIVDWNQCTATVDTARIVAVRLHGVVVGTTGAEHLRRAGTLQQRVLHLVLETVQQRCCTWFLRTPGLVGIAVDLHLLRGQTLHPFISSFPNIVFGVSSVGRITQKAHTLDHVALALLRILSVTQLAPKFDPRCAKR